MIKDKIEILFIHIVLPLFLGGIIYLIFRSPKLLMFKWVKCIGIYYYLYELRIYFLPLKKNLSEWFLYTLPNTLWIYSFTSYMIVIWESTNRNLIKFFCILLPLILGIISEILQLLQIIPGTFDKIDLLFCFIGSGISISYFYKRKEKNYEI